MRYLPECFGCLRNRKARELPTAQLNQVGQRGLDSQMFVSPAHKGPFTRAPASPTATYPSLWSHNARNETRMICVPDSQLLVRQDMEENVPKVWATASRAHLSRGFRFNSQPLTTAFTEQESIGGRAWPNVSFDTPQFDYAFTLWGNSTLGLLCYWWHSSRQVAGRGDMDYPLCRNPPRARLQHPQRRAAAPGRDDLRRVPRPTAPAGLPGRRGPPSCPPRPARHLHPARLRRTHLQSRPPPRRQMVRRAISPRRQAPPPRR